MHTLTPKRVVWAINCVDHTLVNVGGGIGGAVHVTANTRKRVTEV
jgi:hypothetical protein